MYVRAEREQKGNIGLF